MAASDDIKVMLGRVLEGVENLREDFNLEKNSARESRATMHKRLDEQAKEIAKLQQDVAIAGHVDAQVRDRIEALRKEVETNHAMVMPAVDDWKRMKVIGLGLTGFLTIGGLSVGAILMWMGETAVSAVRHWLHID